MKKMKGLPILGREYTVEFLSEKEMDSFSEEFDRGAVAAINYHEKRIVITAGLNFEETLVCLLHEAHHAIQHTVGIDQVLPPAFWEILAESTANGIVDVLKFIAPDMFKEKPKRGRPKKVRS